MIPDGAFPIEKNHCTNIIMHLDLRKAMGEPVDLEMIRAWANVGIAYMNQLDGHSPRQWGDIWRENNP